MVREVIDEARETCREMPAFTASVLLVMALCIGVRGAVFCRADGEQLRLIAHRTEARLDPIRRMYAQADSPVRVPGVTVIFGLRSYCLELSVPTQSLQALVHMERPDGSHRFVPDVRVAI
jgi:hypothetical protein